MRSVIYNTLISEMYKVYTGKVPMTKLHYIALLHGIVMGYSNGNGMILIPSGKLT